jgi:hypothetical protein
VPDGLRRLARRHAVARPRRGPSCQRPLDIAYRACDLPYRFGSRGQIKHRLAEALEPAAGRAGLRANLCTAESKVLFGDGWFELLASARVVAGCQSGASAMDPRG